MTNRLILATMTSLALAACAPMAAPAGPPAPEAAEAEPAAYLALGTEPFWSLEITPGRINFMPGPDRPPMIVKAGPGKPSFNGMRYVSAGIAVDVTYAECSDGMSDRRYADTVTVKAGKESFKGCGGRILPPADLTGTRWKFISIGGVDVAKSDKRLELQFDVGALSGNAGCNGFSTSAAVKENRFTPGPVRSTKMACSPELMKQETEFFALLEGPVSIRYLRDGRMVLTGAGGKTAVLRQSV